MPLQVSTPGSHRRWLLLALPFAFVILLTAVLAKAFADVPLSFIDVYSNLEIAKELSWRATFENAFRAGLEYRPLMTIATKLAYETLGLNVRAYQALVLGEYVAVMVTLLRLWRPTSLPRAIAALVAIACVTGLHSSRILFNFNPLNGGSAVLLVILLSAAAAMEPTARRWDYLYFPVALCAALVVEFGLLLPPVLAALWLVRAPGISTRGVAAAALGAAAYVAIHLGIGAPLAAASHTHSGLGFSSATAERLDATFGSWLWLFWLYNVVATIFTVTFSEPREGTYVFVGALLHGAPPPWMWLHVVSSVATTALVCAALWRSHLGPRDRAIAAVGSALIVAGSALGFLYTRDRIAMPVGVGYAMLGYVGFSRLLGSAPTTRSKRIAIKTVISILAAMWLVRDAELFWFFRDLAWEYHREWTVRYETIRADNTETDLMLALQALELARMPADPTISPAWTNFLLERKFGPSSH